MTIIAYTFEADIHCIECTLDRHHNNPFNLSADPFNYGTGTDENGLPLAAVDKEGNYVHPVFSTDTTDESDSACADCSRKNYLTPNPNQTMTPITKSDLKALLLIASTDASRPHLNGIHIEATAHGVMLVATDGKRMLVLRRSYNIAPFTSGLLKRADAERLIKSAIGEIMTYCGLTELLHADHFPNWRHVIPAGFSHEAETPANFDPAYYASFGKVSKLLGCRQGYIHVHQASNEACVVRFALAHPSTETYRTDAFGIIMPIRQNVEPPAWSKPDWTVYAEPVAPAPTAPAPLVVSMLTPVVVGSCAVAPPADQADPRTISALR